MRLIIACTIVLTSTILLAQPAPPDPPCWPAPCTEIPIDGGLSYLVAAGAILGVRQIRKNKNSND